MTSTPQEPGVLRRRPGAHAGAVGALAGFAAILAGCGGSPDALIAAYESCQGVTVVLDDGEYQHEDGYSGLEDDGNTAWIDGSRAWCVLHELDAPRSVTHRMEKGALEQSAEWDGYTVQWSWPNAGTGLSVVVSTD